MPESLFDGNLNTYTIHHVLIRIRSTTFLTTVNLVHALLFRLLQHSPFKAKLFGVFRKPRQELLVVLVFQVEKQGKIAVSHVEAQNTIVQSFFHGILLGMSDR